MSDEQHDRSRIERRDPWAPPQDAVPPSPQDTPRDACPPPPPNGPYDPYQAACPPGYPGYPYAAWLHPAPRNALGTAALVLGIVGTVAAVTCFGVVLGLPLGVLAVVFGLIGRRRARRGEATNGGQALSGTILGAAAIAVSIAVIALVATSYNGLFGAADVALTSARGTYDKPLGADGTARFDDGTQVTATTPQRFTPPAGADGYTAGDTAYRFTVTVRNTGDADLRLGDYTYYGTAGGDQTDLQLISTSTGELAEDFPDVLRPGQVSKVVFAFDVPPGLTPLQFDFEPTTNHEDAYWELRLR
ncbi:DUF4190 domain-containing protein [Streptomyces silvisoli]|uniref:DUF4190 domain-containing protein n=1 Tax=Streptomyces silvisoli TaxID=3034235 RepID=A0ABT5ZWJ2_9ACTN|nr:DUF4190 domain-containing protein [Streptomyces silvisoli]MDF3294199.1 DUF4190 domain-containing protein [Streptomyces silvisoli]